MSMIRVLIVEDHLIVRDGLASLLDATADMEVVAVASGIRDALPLLEQHDPQIVLADLSLEDGSGMELVRALRRGRRNGRVVILTGLGDGFAASEALDGGAAGYLLKSQSVEEVLDAIRTVAGGQRYIAPTVADKLPEHQSVAREPASQRPGRLELLSHREHEVFLQVVAGASAKDIAQRFCISTKTVESHRSNMNRKLEVRTAADLIRLAITLGIPVAPRRFSDE
jgi:two-component system response regulator NreC